MKEDIEIKYIEDLLKEKDIDIEAIIKSKWRYPIRRWINYKIFILKVFTVDIVLVFILVFKNLFNKLLKCFFKS